MCFGTIFITITDKTSFNYTLNESTNVRLSIYDMIGREINILIESKQDKGDHTIVMEAGNLRGGVYFYKMNIGNNTITGKIVLTK
ncbi:MAG: T9SS type A sorting domain-containing protein [Bacteroidota bacterium]